MYYQGIVVEVLEDSAIILTNEQAFIKIQKKNGLEIGQTIFFLPDDIILPKPKTLPFYKKSTPIMALLAACLLLFFIPFNVQSSPYAVLSVDVNPSFEFELDEQMNIIKVISLNETAKQFDVKSLKGLPLKDGLSTLKEMFAQHHILLDTNALLFSLALSDQQDLNYENQVKESLKTINQNDEFAYLKITDDELALAHEQSLSGAKLKAKQLLNDIDIDDLSVNEIIQLFKDNQLKFDLLFKEGIEIDDDIEDTLEDLLEDFDETMDDDWNENENQGASNDEDDEDDDDDHEEPKEDTEMDEDEEDDEDDDGEDHEEDEDWD